MVGAVVDCPGHVSHDSPAAVLGRHPYSAQISIDLRLGPFEFTLVVREGPCGGFGF